ncbi:radical SAM protein [Planctomicrobium piriforme]|uniref:Radical SAM superfamily enzyme, MoaA/NifB/PqqE/SkfB family n=1 Tax=Planctomicrobium piriforme TaxID=1576369 RepID=A0A1I3NHM3_9PLAN|nr:radical SAM/SPASM domain-containing protein [Planctomicrobium piriforme]SFJ08679.1 Radical SAM superfamily enzyme, MoaA/NifB/PqqE/SkfB family [Planctomicrobium piriforme]
MYLGMARRMAVETDKRLLWKLFWNMGIKGAWSVQRFKNRLKKGIVFPPFLYVSVINSCNLRCQGCWVDVSAKQQTIDLQAMNGLINDAKAQGNVFFGIVGGEPFMHPQLLDILAAHPDCYFQVFTNGHFITADVAKRLRELGNVTPLISIEGSEIVSDERRGRKGVLSKSMQGLQNCLDHKLFTGVCTSVCQTNIDDLVTEKWVDRLIEKGVFYTWFHVYRPMGPDASADLCLTAEQQLRIRKFVVDMRCSKPIIFVDAYSDHQGQALCPAATGITHHINPWGGIEPCPIIQFTKDSIHDGSKSLAEKLDSPFLRDFRELARETTRGCIVLERPDLLEALIHKHDAQDGTVRKSALTELQAMHIRPSQYNPDQAIPERSWAYRLAKKFFFNDFGAYTGRHHEQYSAPAVLAAPNTPPAAPPLVELQVRRRETAHSL